MGVTRQLIVGGHHLYDLWMFSDVERMKGLMGGPYPSYPSFDDFTLQIAVKSWDQRMWVCRNVIGTTLFFMVYIYHP